MLPNNTLIPLPSFWLMQERDTRLQNKKLIPSKMSYLGESDNILFTSYNISSYIYRLTLKMNLYDHIHKYFESQIGETRFTDTIYNADGNINLNAERRQAWTEYLDTRASKTAKRLTPQIVNDMKESISKHIHQSLVQDISDLETKIITAIKQPNQDWKK